MAPAILLFPSVTVQASPCKPSGQRLIPSSSPGHLACSHWALRGSSLFILSARAAKCSSRAIVPYAWRVISAAAAGGEVSVEEATAPAPAPAATVEQEEDDAAPGQEEPSSTVEASSTPSSSSSPSSPARTQGRRARRDSPAKNVTVPNEELVPGAVFSGKVSAIQTFGAFVDFGAFTNGLVHISRLSKAYVKKVEDVVQPGQEVNVQILDVDFKAGRISLMLKEEESEVEQSNDRKDNASQQQARSAASNRNSKRRNQTSQPSTKLKKGEIITGTVKNIIRSGVFLSLPDGNDGYLPAMEVVYKGPVGNLESQFQVGQEVTVRVLRIEKGRITLTTKQEIDLTKLNEALNSGVDGTATNPFEIAFRQNNVIGSFLAAREKLSAQDTEEDKEAAVEEEAVEEKEEISAEGAVNVSSEAVVEEKTLEQKEEVPAEEPVNASSEAVVEEKASEETVEIPTEEPVKASSEAVVEEKAPVNSSSEAVVEEKASEETVEIPTEEPVNASSEAVVEEKASEESEEIPAEEPGNASSEAVLQEKASEETEEIPAETEKSSAGELVNASSEAVVEEKVSEEAKEIAAEGLVNASNETVVDEKASEETPADVPVNASSEAVVR